MKGQDCEYLHRLPTIHDMLVSFPCHTRSEDSFTSLRVIGYKNSPLIKSFIGSIRTWTALVSIISSLAVDNPKRATDSRL